MGWNVSVYANTGTEEQTIDGVRWIPFAAWNYRDKQDVTRLWRHAKVLDYPINSDVILVDMHDVVSVGEFTPIRIARATKVMFKSNVQRGYYPHIPDDKVAIIPHGLDITQFEERRNSVVKNPYKIINTSSADRGLMTSMDIVERVYRALPPALKPKLKFRWNYGFRVWDADFAKNEKMSHWKEAAVKKMNELKALGIMEKESGDMLPQDEIVDQYLEAGMILYPSEFFEIGFISGAKGLLGGAIPATTDVFAQGEFLREGIIVHSDRGYSDWKVNIEGGNDYGVQKVEQINEFVNGIVRYMTNPEKFDHMRERLIAYARGTFNWDVTAQKWVEQWTK
jgi:glycosyltransferase involved in cell wall biosynthesis